jgi:hypothetical protein
MKCFHKYNEEFLLIGPMVIVLSFQAGEALFVGHSKIYA